MMHDRIKTLARRWHSVALALILSGLSTATLAQVPDHPRLIVDSQRIVELRGQTHQVTPPSQWTERMKVCHLAYRSIVTAAVVYRDLPWSSGSWRRQGIQFLGVTSLAMGHLMRTGEASYDDEYLAALLELFDEWRTHDYPMWGEHFTDLNTGELLACWALAFDWLYDDMAAFDLAHGTNHVANNVAALCEMLDRMVISGNIVWRLDNNHVGIAYGGRGLAALALDGHLTGIAEEERQAILATAVNKVTSYLDYAYPLDGSGYEGGMYSNYGMNVALPFGLATDRLDSHLPSNLRVHLADARCVQQAGNWIAYEQLPYFRFGGPPLNNTDEAPRGLNPPSFRAWPWLLALGNSSRPSLIKHVFLTTYPPTEIDAALSAPFDPDSPPANGYGVLFSQAGLGYREEMYNGVPILLGWPESSAPPEAFIDPSTAPASRSFFGRGIAYFRSSLHAIEASGGLSTDPQGHLITFECRNPATWIASGRHTGHANYDQNHFTMVAYGEPLFWDSGYDHYPWKDGTHNTHLMEYDGAFQGYRRYPEIGNEPKYAPGEGQFLRSLFGSGCAPSMAAGDNSLAWNFERLGEPPLVDRCQRHFFVVPRGDGEQPYIILHDDIDYAGTEPRRVQWLWQSADSTSEPGFLVDEPSKTASILKGEAGAFAKILHPATMESMTQDPLQTEWGTHWRLVSQTGLRENADLVVFACPFYRYTPDISAMAIESGDPNILACKVQEADRTDVIVFRRGGVNGIWAITVDGKVLSGNGQQAIVRFQGSGLDWAGIGAGMLLQGSRLWFDGRLVAGANAANGMADLVFSSEQVTVNADVVPTYFIGPVIPQAAVVNGQSQGVQMWNVPHPLTSEFPISVGRSPANETVIEPFQYDVSVTLRNWAGNPVPGWPSGSASLDLVGCQNPSTGNPPLGPSDVDGVMIWKSGLTTGGSYEAPGDRVVCINVVFDLYGPTLLHSYPSVTSPDQDGNGLIDLADKTVLMQAIQTGAPLYQGDLDRDGRITRNDMYWFTVHAGQDSKSANSEDAAESPTWIRNSDEVQMGPASPNPMTMELQIPIYLPSEQEVRCDVYDVGGRLVREVFNGRLPRGVQTLRWDGTLQSGESVGAGVFFYRLTHAGGVIQGRTVVLK